jgi:hypothetical protein
MGFQMLMAGLAAPERLACSQGLFVQGMEEMAFSAAEELAEDMAAAMAAPVVLATSKSGSLNDESSTN